jgi:hypothetical protein
VRWPAGLEPAGADLHRSNTVVAPVPVEWAWAWLVRPRIWSQWYRNALLVDCDDEVLAVGSSFRWVTFGLPVRSVVDVCEPHHALGWKWSGPGLYGYHVWVLQKHDKGCTIRTDETQFGSLPSLLGWLIGPLLGAGHDYWLRSLARTSVAGPPIS